MTNVARARSRRADTNVQSSCVSATASASKHGALPGLWDATSPRSAKHKHAVQKASPKRFGGGGGGGEAAPAPLSTPGSNHEASWGPVPTHIADMGDAALGDLGDLSLSVSNMSLATSS